MRVQSTPSTVLGQINPLPLPAVSRFANLLLERHSPGEIGAAIDVLIDVLNLLGGDPDHEDNGDDEWSGDELDCAWIEWHTMRGSQKRGPNITKPHEDAEEDDPAGQCDEDGCNTFLGALQSPSAGCSISDPGGCEHDGREHDEAGPCL